MDGWGVRRTVSLAAELKRWRDRRGLSYRSLARRVACEHSHLWKIEHGKAVLTREMAEACDHALGAGGALIAAWVNAQGTVRPAQLPIAPARVLGRDAELATLRGQMDARTRGVPAVFAIDGPAGVGKTTLAVRWAHEVADKYVDGQLYADLGGFAPPGRLVTVSAVLERFLAAMGATSIPDTTAERAALYRSLLAERKVLVVLDNVAEAGKVEPLLPATAGCAVVVTSRRVLSVLVAQVGATRLTLKPLAENDSIALLSQVIGEPRATAEPASVAKLARLCGHLPVALRLAAEQVATYPRRPVAELVDELLEAEQHSSMLDILDLRPVLSWSYDQLGPEAGHLFRLLGLNPRLTASALATLTGLTLPQVRGLLHQLASIHLVDIGHDNVLRLPALTCAYARELAVSDGEQQQAAG